MLVQNGITFALDTPDAIPVNARDYILKGWCVTPHPSDRLEIILDLDGVRTAASLGFSRPDVAEHFHNPALVRSGFLIRFRVPEKTKSVALLGRLNGVDNLLRGEIKVPVRNATSGVATKATCYEEWLAVNEPRLFWKENEIASRMSGLAYQPRISIILPTYNTPPYFLQRCIESVREQYYENWELCITDDRSPDGTTFLTCEEYARADSRIRLERAAEQGGISAASNIALKNATGDFIVLLDHDDELHPFALLEVVRALNSRDEYQLLYSDEDKIDQWGIRSQPAFKPDFDPNVFLSFNYLGHLVALKRSVVTEIGGFRPSCDGAQDWDLLIRATELIGPRAIRHIRKPLYHWRMHEDSTSLSLDSKPYAARAWVNVLEDHISRSAKKARVVEGLFHGSMRIQYEAPKQIEVAVFLRQEDGIFQAAVVQMNAGRRVVHVYQTIGCAAFELPAFGKAAVAAAAGAYGDGGMAGSSSLCSLTEIKGELLVFINGPLECLNHLFFEELVAQASRNDCGLVTGISLDAQNQTIATGLVRTADNVLVDPYVGIEVPGHGYLGQLSVVRSIDSCPETFFAVRREHLAAVGGLGAFSNSHMRRLASMLSKNATEKGLSIISTPYAVATFSSHSPSPVEELAEQGTPDSFRLNPQILSFENSCELLQGRAKQD